MQKNFFEYVKELVPEKGSVFFTRNNHSVWNGISLYKVADLLNGQKIEEAEDITAYSWNVLELYHYNFPTMGLMFWKDGKEVWIHFSKNAFYGAICIVASKNNITFDNKNWEHLRQIWERKINNQETEEDKQFLENFQEKESNFNDETYAFSYKRDPKDFTEEEMQKAWNDLPEEEKTKINLDLKRRKEKREKEFEEMQKKMMEEAKRNKFLD